MSLNKNLLEEINRFRMMSSYEPGKLLNEQKILNEEMFFGKQDKYFLVTYKKNGKPKLTEIGTNIVEENKFLPTEYGKKLLGIEQESIQFIQLQKNATFQKYRSVAVDKDGNEPRIVTDAELDDFVENLIEKNLNYQQELKNRESVVKGSNWNGNNSGKIICNIGMQQTYANAYNVPNPSDEFPEAKRMNLLEAMVMPASTKLSPTTTPKETVTVTFDKVKVNSGIKTYCDNMIKPNMSNPKVVDEMDDIIKRLKAYISAPPDAEGKTALSKLTNITILGQADSAAPGWVPGPPCTGSIDHNYGGIERIPRKERSEQMIHSMNKFLATNRASEYKKIFIQRVKEQLGIDIVINELPSIEYYGKGESFRGEKYRSIEINFNAPPHTYDNVIKQDPTQGKLIIDKIESSGYDAMLSSLNTPEGIKKYTTITKGKDLYVSENNILMSKNSPDSGTLDMLHKYSYGVDATLEGYNLKIKTSAGVVTLIGYQGTDGDAFTAGMQSAFFQTWTPSCDQQFLEVTAVSYPVPNQDAFYSYKEDEVIVIDNENYYKLYGSTYVLLPMTCTNKTSTPPSKAEIMASLISTEPRYTDKQLSYLGKKVQKMIKKDLKDLEKLNKPKGGLESIQQDIQFD
jgi:hypothetical protein